jgi:uncharacterized membrane protein
MKLERNAPYWLLITASLLWLGLVLLAPWARQQDWPAAAWLYAFFAPVCHQIPGRSFGSFGNPFAVCHRCFGLYLGFTVGLLVLPYLHRLRERLLERPREILVWFAPMLIDVALRGWNVPPSRFATGLVAAFPVGLFVWAAASQLFRRTTDPTQRIDQHEWSQSQ